MDCLDRTNVVQSMLGRRFLTTQLVAAGVLDATDAIVAHPAVERVFRNGAARGLVVAWMPQAYTGEGAAADSVGGPRRRRECAVLGHRCAQDRLYAVRVRAPGCWIGTQH
jgi:hypothetical protein